MKITVKDIAYNGIIAALYVILTLVTYPISFLGIQFRIAEILILLCFFRKDYCIGLTIGCFISNLFSQIGLIDAAFGTAATLLSCILIMFSKHLAIAVIFPIVFNAFIVGTELYLFVEAEFWISVGYVAIGEAVVMIVGYIIFMIFKKKSSFHKLIRSTQNVDFKF